MKKFVILFFGVAIVTGSCKKEDLEPEFPFTITVKTLKDSLRAPNVEVILNADNPDSKVEIKGWTDVNGEVHLEYSHEAILNITAIRSNGPNTIPAWIGCSDINLVGNDRVYKTVYIEPYSENTQGCIAAN